MPKIVPKSELGENRSSMLLCERFVGTPKLKMYWNLIRKSDRSWLEIVLLLKANNVSVFWRKCYSTHCAPSYSTQNKILSAVRWLPVSREFILQEGIEKSYNYLITMNLKQHWLLTCTLIGFFIFPSILICSVALSEPEYQTLAPSTLNSLTPIPIIIPPLRRKSPLSRWSADSKREESSLKLWTYGTRWKIFQLDIKF